MSVIELELPDAVLQRAKTVADEQHLPLDNVIANAITEMLSAREQMAYLRARAERGRSVDIKAILRKAPDVEPDPSDRID